MGTVKPHDLKDESHLTVSLNPKISNEVDKLFNANVKIITGYDKLDRNVGKMHKRRMNNAELTYYHN